MFRITCCVAVVVVSLSSRAVAQQDPAQIRDIQKQIEALQKQLESAQTASSGKVTQLGPQPRYRSSAPATTVRVYDLSDLFAVAPAYEAQIGSDVGLEPQMLFPEAVGSGVATGRGAGFIGGGGGGFFSLPRQARNALEAARQIGPAVAGAEAGATKSSMTDLIKSIQGTIAPSSWQEAGGSGSIATLGTSLIVSADPDVHEQIDSLVGLLRKRWGTLRTVSINAYWIWLTDRQLAKLLPGDGKGPAGAGLKAFGVLTDESWAELGEMLDTARRAAPKDAAGNPVPSPAAFREGYRAIISAYNGQSVFTQSGTEEPVVAEIEPVITRDESSVDDAPAGRVGYRPVRRPVQEGAALQVTPLVNTSGRFVVLDIHSRVAIRDKSQTSERAPSAGRGEVKPQDVVSALDRPRFVTQRLATTLRVPVDRVALIGGMTFTARPELDEPSLYLFVRSTVQELRDDTQPSAENPAAQEPAASPVEPPGK